MTERKRSARGGGFKTLETVDRDGGKREGVVNE